MPMKAGTVTDFANSLAEAMDKALATEYLAVKGEPLPDMGEEDRRLMFVAIAQGLLRYLKDNSDAFELAVQTEQVTGESGAPLMRSTNPASIAVSGGGNINANNANVTQINATDNRIVSRGTATGGTITTVGVLHP